MTMHLSKSLQLYTKKDHFTGCKLYLNKPDFKKEKSELEALELQLCALVNNEIFRQITSSFWP